jgi:hypothetical protein
MILKSPWFSGAFLFSVIPFAHDSGNIAANVFETGISGRLNENKSIFLQKD